MCSRVTRLSYRTVQLNAWHYMAGYTVDATALSAVPGVDVLYEATQHEVELLSVNVLGIPYIKNLQ